MNLETRALQLMRSLLDLDPGAREQALQRDAGDDISLAARVRGLLAALDEDDESLPGGPAVVYPDAVGEALGPYVLRELIGRGGMGEVYRADRADGAYHKEVAIKRIHGGFAPLVARFLRERQVLARLQHPHIAQLLDGGIDQHGKPWLAMELVLGDRLNDWCDAHRSSLRARVELVRQVCEAVEYAHRNLVVHRDIKPSNVLVDAHGNAKLLDFGIARLLDDADGERTLTHAMTPAWAAPEQRAGAAVTTASDVFQLGLLLRVLLLGGMPVEPDLRLSREYARLHSSEAARALELASLRNTSPDALARALKGDLDAIVAHATATSPGERYATAGALAQDLQRWLAALPVHARGDERGYRARRAARKWWPALAAGMVGIGFLIYHVHSLQWSLEFTRQARARASQAEQRALQERDNARYVSEQLVGIFAASSPDGAQSAQLSARDLLDNAEAAFEHAEAEDGQPAASALVWDALSRIHGSMGDDARALRVQARAVAAAHRAEDPQLLAEALRTQAWAFYRHDQPADAYRSASEAKRVLDRVAMQATSLYARVQNAAGFAALSNGDEAEGWRQLDASLALLARIGADAGKLRFGALLNATEAALVMGERTRAARWLVELQALPGFADNDPVAPMQLGTRRARLARMQDQLTVSNARMAHFTAQAERYFGAAHPEAISYANEYAKGLMATGDFDRAAQVLAGALRNSSAALPTGHTLTQDIRGMLGIAQLLQGRTDDAKANLEAVVDWRARKGQSEMGQGPALERVALARLDCMASAQDTPSWPRLDASHAEPWEMRLAEQWRSECAASGETTTTPAAR